MSEKSPWAEMGFGRKDAQAIQPSKPKPRKDTFKWYTPGVKWGHDWRLRTTARTDADKREQVYLARTCRRCGLAMFLADGARCRGRRA